jgi:DNA-binding NarL/FixJ family response regulator
LPPTRVAFTIGVTTACGRDGKEVGSTVAGRGYISYEERSFAVLVVDEDPDLRLLVRVLLQGEPRFRLVGEEISVASAVAGAARVGPDVIVLDYHVPDDTGLDVIPALWLAAPGAVVVGCSAFADERLPGQVAFMRAVDAFVDKLELSQALVPTMLAMARSVR